MAVAYEKLLFELARPISYVNVEITWLVDKFTLFCSRKTFSKPTDITDPALRISMVIIVGAIAGIST